MRGKGINYDTGFFDGSRTTFEPHEVRRELQIIADDLHCTAVRISGQDPARLSVAGALALEAGLEVWFAPFPHDMTTAELVPYFAECARRAEDLRKRSPDVVLVLGCELTLFHHGFMPGANAKQRIAKAIETGALATRIQSDVNARLNVFLAEASAAVRPVFGGSLTYASGKWEDVDWRLFDIVSVDAYRERKNASGYVDHLRAYRAHGKPLAATEFGCCTFRGAGDLGGAGWTILDQNADPPRIVRGYERDESEQVRYMRDLLEIFAAEGVDTAFWFTFAAFEAPHRDDPMFDYDMASYGVVKMLEGRNGATYPDMRWEPKQAFHALAEVYARMA